MSDQDTPEILPAEPPAARPISMRRTTSERDAKILELSAKGLTQEEIAPVVDCSQQTVSRILKQFEGVFQTLPRVSEYRTVKADILAAGQLAALESALSPAKVAKAGFLSTLQGFEILNKAERLETGKSTENLAHVFGKVPLE